MSEPQSNAVILSIFEQLVDLKQKKLLSLPNATAEDKQRRKVLSIKAGQFKRAIAVLRQLDYDVTSGKEAMKLKGIGKGMADRIDEILNTGTLEELSTYLDDDQIRAATIAQELCRIPGIGSAAASKLVTQYGVTGIDDVRARIDELGLSAHVKVALKHLEDLQQRIPWDEVEAMALCVRETLQAKISRHLVTECCGSHRRGAADSGDVDILLTWPAGRPWPRGLTEETILGRCVEVLQEAGVLVDHLTTKGTKKYMGVARLSADGTARHLDLRYVPAESWPAALLYFTGSGAFNTRMRKHAEQRGFRLNEYGLYRVRKTKTAKKASGRAGSGKKAGGKEEILTLVPASSERDIFDALEYPWAAPIDRH